MFIFDFLDWWYTDFFVATSSWTNLLHLFVKTCLLIVLISIAVKIIKGIIKFIKGLVVAFTNGWNRTMKEDNKKE